MSMPIYIPPWHENKISLAIYYGSALNRFIDECCSHEMTAINIDLIIQKISIKRLRLIESKNKAEGMRKGQENLFCRLLPKLFTFLNQIPKPTFLGYHFDIFLVIGEWPYEGITKIKNLSTGEIRSATKKELIKFLNFQLEFEGLKGI